VHLTGVHLKTACGQPDGQTGGRQTDRQLNRQTDS
jgi:hypothetical protein